MKIRQIATIWLSVYVMSLVLSAGIMIGDDDLRMSESELGVLCVQAVYPAITRGTGREAVDGIMMGKDIGDNDESSVKAAGVKGEAGTGKSDASGEGAGAGKNEGTTGENDGVNEGIQGEIIDTQNPDAPTPATVNVQKNKPLVIIYHTHATEAYQPVSTGNFRTTEEAGSVREVGTVLAEELEKMGIGVVHDKTLHDAESYNQSYTRSLETVKRLISENPSAVFVIDLHRDAAAYTGNVGKTVEIDGETAATFSLVVGQGNENANSLNIFANTVLNKAEEMYPGFTNRLIEKEYKYNQYVSDYCLLLEVGNNENNIKETRVTAKYFAKVLKAVIDDVT